MTIIAWDGQTMACDGMACLGHGGITDWDVKKIHHCPEGVLIAGTGNHAEILSMVEYQRGGIPDSPPPDIEQDESQFILWHPAHGMSWMNTKLHKVPVQWPHAIGAGDEAAKALMDIGYTARQAVQYVIDNNIYAGGEIQVEDTVWRYRDYNILLKWRQPDQPDKWIFSHREYTGDTDQRCGDARTLEEAREQIDELEDA